MNLVKIENYENMPSICKINWIEFRPVFRIFKDLNGQESTHRLHSNNHIYLGQISLCTCSNSLDEGFKLSSCFSFVTSSEQKVWFGAARGSNLAWPGPARLARPALPALCQQISLEVSCFCLWQVSRHRQIAGMTVY